MTAMANEGKPILKLLLRLAITAGLLAWVFSGLELGSFQLAVRQANLLPLLGVWGVSLLVISVQTQKFRIILRHQECDVSFPTLFGISAVTVMYSLVLPGMLNTGVKWCILQKLTAKGTHVLGSMVYNQLSDTVVVTCIGLAMLAVTNPAAILYDAHTGRWILPAICTALLLVVVLITLLLLHPVTGGRLLRVPRFLVKPLRQALRRKVEDSLDRIALFQTAGLRFHAKITSLSFACGFFGGLAIYWLAATAANIHVPTMVLVLLFAVVHLAGILPISVANLGVREATLTGLLGIYGVAPSQAVLMSMMIFSTTIIMSLVGLVYQISWACQGWSKDGPTA